MPSTTAPPPNSRSRRVVYGLDDFHGCWYDIRSSTRAVRRASVSSSGTDSRNGEGVLSMNCAPRRRRLA